MIYHYQARMVNFENDEKRAKNDVGEAKFNLPMVRPMLFIIVERKNKC